MTYWGYFNANIWKDKSRNKKKSGRWGQLFNVKCAEGRVSTAHTSEAYPALNFNPRSPSDLITNQSINVKVLSGLLFIYPRFLYLISKIDYCPANETVNRFTMPFYKITYLLSYLKNISNMYYVLRSPLKSATFYPDILWKFHYVNLFYLK